MYNAQTAYAAKQYSTVQVHSSVMEATPHQLIQMLLEGALDRIIKARNYMMHGNVAEKGSHIGMAISIVSGLRASLDEEQGGEIAANLAALYDYIERRLLEANVRNDAKILDEVAVLLREVRLGWESIPAEMRGQPVAR